MIPVEVAPALYRSLHSALLSVVPTFSSPSISFSPNDHYLSQVLGTRRSQQDFCAARPFHWQAHPSLFRSRWGSLACKQRTLGDVNILGEISFRRKLRSHSMQCLKQFDRVPIVAQRAQ